MYSATRSSDTSSIKKLKTDKGQTVDLSARIAGALNHLRALAEAEAIVAGKDVLRWIFATRTG